MNLCSCVVYTQPGSGAVVAPRLAALPGVEVHGGADVDKLVVTVEDTAEHLSADTIGALSHVPGVINAVLIYHYGGDDLGPQACPAPAG